MKQGNVNAYCSKLFLFGHLQKGQHFLYDIIFQKEKDKT